MKMVKFHVLAPGRNRRKWQVRGYSRYNMWVGTWSCDSEAIAREVCRRLENGLSLGWVAHDLRHQPL